MDTDEAYTDLVAALKWGAKLELTDKQRHSLESLCAKICGKGWKSGKLKRLSARCQKAEEELAWARSIGLDWFGALVRGRLSEDANASRPKG